MKLYCTPNTTQPSVKPASRLNTVYEIILKVDFDMYTYLINIDKISAKISHNIDEINGRFGVKLIPYNVIKSAIEHVWKNNFSAAINELHRKQDKPEWPYYTKCMVDFVKTLVPTDKPEILNEILINMYINMPLISFTEDYVHIIFKGDK